MTTFRISCSHFSSDEEFAYIRAVDLDHAYIRARSVFSYRQQHCENCGSLLSVWSVDNIPNGLEYNTIYDNTHMVVERF